MGCNKQQRKRRIIWNFTKEDTFFISYNNQALLVEITRSPTFLHPPKRMPSFPLQFVEGENIPGHSFERKTY